MRLGALSSRQVAGTILAAIAIVGCSLDDRILVANVDSGRSDTAGVERSGAAVACMSARPSSSLVTNFSDAKAATNLATGQPVIAFGTSPQLTGETWTNASADLSAPILSLISTGDDVALQAIVNPGAPRIAGDNLVYFGLDFTGCVDASAYSGVTFTVEAIGGLGSCELAFGILISEDDSANGAPGVGTCDANTCSPPLIALTLGTQTVPFTEPFGGMPDHSVDRSAITGLQWQLSEPNTDDPCVTTLRVDDISFAQ